MHTLGQVAIEYDESGDAAEVTAYFDNPMLMRAGEVEPTIVEVGGLYHHTMVRTPRAGAVGACTSAGVETWI